MFDLMTSRNKYNTVSSQCTENPPFRFFWDTRYSPPFCPSEAGCQMLGKCRQKTTIAFRIRPIACPLGLISPICQECRHGRGAMSRSLSPRSQRHLVESARGDWPRLEHELSTALYHYSRSFFVFGLFLPRKRNP